MDALEAFDDDGLDPEHRSALGGPIARGTGAVFLAAEHDERHAVVDVVAGRLVDGRRLHRQEIVGVTAGPDLLSHRGEEHVAQTDIAEGAAHHDLMVATTRSV